MSSADFFRMGNNLACIITVSPGVSDFFGLYLPKGIFFFVYGCLETAGFTVVLAKPFSEKQ